MSALFLSNLEFRSLVNSLTISLSVSFLTTFAGLILSVCILYLKLPGRKILPWLILLPLLIPPYLQAFSWMHLLLFLGDLQLFQLTPSSGAELISSLPGVIGILTIAYFPLTFFVIFNALKTIPNQLIAAARLIVSPAKALIRIIIPSIISSVASAALLSFIFSFITFDVPAFLGVNVFVTQIFKSFAFSNEVGRALYLSIIPAVIVGICGSTLFKFFIKNKPFFNFKSNQNSQNILIKQSLMFRILISAVIFLVIMITVILPLIILQLKSLIYETVPFYTASSAGVVVNTLWISFSASTCLVLFSIFIFYLLHKNFWVRYLMLMLFVLPQITYGLVFIYLFNRQALNFIYSTPLILILAYSLRFAPIVYELIHSRNQSVNPHYLDSARLLAAPNWQSIRLIILPFYLPVLFLSWMLSFWLTATELPITLLVQPPGFQTIITRLFIVLHYGAAELMSQMTLTLLLMSIVPIIAVYLFFRSLHYDER